MHQLYFSPHVFKFADNAKKQKTANSGKERGNKGGKTVTNKLRQTQVLALQTVKMIELKKFSLLLYSHIKERTIMVCICVSFQTPLPFIFLN